MIRRASNGANNNNLCNPDSMFTDFKEYAMKEKILALKKDLNANFDITGDGGIDHPDSVIGVEHALKFAEWTGYNQALKDVLEIL